MVYFTLKVLTSAIMIAFISEISKRNSFLGAIFASLPLISVMAIVWLYIETHSSQKIISLSNSIFWLVLPSLTLFLTLPALLKLRLSFWIALPIAIIATIVSYFVMTLILKKFGVHL